MDDIITQRLREPRQPRVPAAPTPPTYDPMQGYMNPDFDSANWPKSQGSHVVTEDDIDMFLLPEPPT